MTVRELKEKLNEFDDNLIVMIPDDNWTPDKSWLPYIPATSVARGVNEDDGCLFIDDYVEDEESKTCGECANYTGLGDWNLCCKEEHDPKEFPFGHLCYEDTQACDKFKPIDRLTEEEFYKKYCQMCGSQRCEGICTEWFDGCKFKDYLKQ